jgi:hypothetical protein
MVCERPDSWGKAGDDESGDAGHIDSQAICCGDRGLNWEKLAAPGEQRLHGGRRWRGRSISPIVGTDVFDEAADDGDYRRVSLRGGAV